MRKRHTAAHEALGAPAARHGELKHWQSHQYGEPWQPPYMPPAETLFPRAPRRRRCWLSAIDHHPRDRPNCSREEVYYWAFSLSLCLLGHLKWTGPLEDGSIEDGTTVTESRRRTEDQMRETHHGRWTPHLFAPNRRACRIATSGVVCAWWPAVERKIKASSKTIIEALMVSELSHNCLIDLRPILLPKTKLQTVDDGLF